MKNKWKTATIVLICLIIFGFIVYNVNQEYEKSFQYGFLLGQISVMNYTTLTGNIPYLENNTMRIISVKDLCSGGTG